MRGVYQTNDKLRRTGFKNMVKRVAAAVLTLVLVLSLTVSDGRVAFLGLGEAVYAAGSVRVVETTNAGRVGEQNITLTVTLENQSGGTLEVYGIIEATDAIKVVKDRSDSVKFNNREQKDISFTVDIKNSASKGYTTIPLKIYQNGTNAEVDSLEVRLDINEKTAAPITGTNPLVALDMDFELSNPDGIVAGETTVLTLTLYNRGNSMMKNAYVSLDLPDGLYLENVTGSQSLGYLPIGGSGSVRFNIRAEEDIESKNYPIDITVSSLDESNSERSTSEKLYLPVKSNKTKFSVDNLEIKNISIPAEIPAGEEFTLSFSLANNGSNAVNDLQIEATMPEGVVNKTKNIFVIPSIAAGRTETFTVTATTTDKSKEEYYPVKITVSSTKEENNGTITQYAGTYSKVEETSDTKTPQLMVSSYSYGGSHVQAGDNFNLSLGIYNTSAAGLKNIKVTVTSDDGVFIPVNSSNSFYLDGLEAKGRTSQSLPMTSKRDAEQKTSSLTVEMSYEDKDGNDFTSKDVISIPVMQETRLVIDDLISPPDIYVGNQSYTSLEFYNMGKTTLNNLRVNATGNFSTSQSNSYYVGNMEPGSQDSYDFSYIPMEAGIMSGTVTFNYETATGELITVVKDFEFDVMEMAPWDDWGDEFFEEEEKPLPWATIIAAAVIVLLIVIGIIVWRIRKKKKQELEMEIDE